MSLDLGTKQALEDIKNIRKEMSALIKDAEQYAKSFKLPTTGSGNSGGSGGSRTPKTKPDTYTKQYTKLINDEANAVAKLNALQKEEIQLKIQSTQAAKQKTKDTQAELQATNSQLNAYQRLHAQTRQAIQDALSEGAALEALKNDRNASSVAIQNQNKLYQEARSRATQYTTTLNRLKRETGQADFATNGMYGATYSLTQVMRELPNFAIDARIGFMALSNNLPYLAEQFQATARSIDNMTGKQVGALGALKTFAKSLLSLNTIMILVSTAFVLFGKDIVNFISNIGDATDAVDSFAEAQKALNDEIENFESPAYKQNEKLTEGLSILRATRDELLNLKYNFKSDDAEQYWAKSAKALNYFKQQFGGKLTEEELSFIDLSDIKNIEQVEKAIRVTTNYIDKFTKAQQYRSAADKLAADKSKLLAENQKIYNEALEKYKDATDEDSIKKAERLKEAMAAPLRAQGFLIDGDMFKGSEDVLKNIKTAIELQQRIDALRYETALLYNIPSESSDKSGFTRSAKTDFEEELYYNEERANLMRSLADLENEMSKSLEDGTLNSFDARMRATEEFYSAKDKILAIDFDKTKFEIEQERKVREEALKKKQEDNKKLLNEGKISSSEFAKADKELQDAIITNNKNANTKLKEADDEYTLGVIDNAHDKAKKVTDIAKDQYDLEVELLEDKYERENKLRDEAFEKEKQAIRDKYKLNRLLGGDSFTYEIEMQNAQTKNKIDNINEEIKQKEEQIKILRDKGIEDSEEEKDLLREVANLRNNINHETAMNELELAEMVKDKKEELELEILDGMKQIGQETISSLFQIYFDEIEKQKERFNVIEDERLKQIEDKEEAGILTKKEAEEEKLRLSEYYENVQKKLDKDRADAERKQFLLGQAIALGEIAAKTATGVVTYLSNPLTAPLVPLVIATGAVQAGIVAAQSIPYFEDGTDYAPEGLAVVGEKRSEAIFNPDGTIQITPSTPTLTYLKEGAKVIPSLGELNAIEKQALYHQVGLEPSYDFGRLEKKIDNISINQTMNVSEINLFHKMKFSSRSKGLFN